MAVISLAGFKTEPGGLAQHLALTGEAVTLLRGMDMAAVALQAVAGGDIGTIAVTVNYASSADYAASIQKTQADAGWQEFYGRAVAANVAAQVESSLFTDLDPNFQPDPDRPLGAVLAIQWRAKAGRFADFAQRVSDSAAHIERMGGRFRAMQSVIGLHPMTMLISIAFENLDGYGAYADKSAADAEWQAFWGGFMADPSADIVRSGLYLNVSPA